MINILRIALTIALIAAVTKETGVWTGITLLLIMLALEMVSLLLFAARRRIEQLENERLR